MEKKIRLIILISCVFLFLIGAAIIVPYSMGYRFDIEKMKILKTGGIYVRTFPAADNVIFDEKINLKPGFFSNEVFIQSLLPGTHTVLVQKENYHEYYKKISVEEERVTKLENILLFKKDIKYAVADKKIKSPFEFSEKFILKNENLYYSNAPENSKLTATQKTTPLLKKVLSFTTQNNSIIWFSADGLLYKSDSQNFKGTPEKLSETPIKIIKTGSYSIITDWQNIFLNNNGALMLLDKNSKTFKEFYPEVEGAVISPDGRNIAVYDNKNIRILSIGEESRKQGIIHPISEKIKSLIWLNNDYVIFVAGDKIIISEIDYRGNVNIVAMPERATIPADPTIKNSVEKTITIKNPQIFFNSQEGKLYVLTEKTLLISDKLVP